MSDRLLKVMLVDDEKLIRQLVKGCINWEELGMEIAAEAAGGHEALDLIEEVQPDIVFVDISMPFMDGLELSKRIMQRYPLMKIIILTAHDRFEYARRSVAIGVYDYILKPINRDEIKDVVIKVKKTILEEEDRVCEYQRLKKQLDESFPYLKEKFLNDLISGRVHDGNLIGKLAYFKIETSDAPYRIALVEVKCESGRDDEEAHLIVELEALDIIKKFFHKERFITIFRDSRGRIVILNNNYHINLAESCEIINNQLINRVHCHTCIGIGESQDSTAALIYSYKQACSALDYKVIEGKNTVINSRDVLVIDKTKVVMKEDSSETLALYLKAGIAHQAGEIVEVFLSELSVKPGIGITDIRVIAANIVSIVMNTLANMEIGLQDVFFEDNPYARVFLIDTLPEMRDYLHSLIRRAANSINMLHKSRTSKLISDVKEYVIEHISDFSLSLNSIAEIFHINASYLSRKFKGECGQTFMEYIAKLRIDRTIELIKETDLLNYEIADKVGIEDPHYFSIFFKKYMNMTISDYRKLIKEDILKKK